MCEIEFYVSSSNEPESVFLLRISSFGGSRSFL